MRHSLALAVAASLVIGFAGSIPVARADSKADAKKLLARYFDQKTPEADLKGLIKELDCLPPDTLKSGLTKGVKDSKTQSRALALATELQFHGLFKSVKGNYDGDNRDAIIAYAFAAQDEGAVEFLFERWSLAEPTSDEFAALQKGFVGTGFSYSLLQQFVTAAASAEGSERRKAACEVIANRIGMDITGGIPEVEAVSKRWEELKDDLKKMGGPIKTEGVELFRRCAWSRKKAASQALGGSWKLLATAWLDNRDSMPESANTGNYSIKARVWIGSKDSKATAGFTYRRGEQMHSMAFQLEGDAWRVDMKPPTEPKKGKLVVTDWNVLQWDIKIPDPKDKQKISVSMLVNGVPVTEDSVVSEGVTQVNFNCAEGSIVVGSVDYLRTE